MAFTALSPPGPSRLVRIPFYPLVPSQAWNGATGIDTPGDDPVLDITIPTGSTRSPRYTMLTYQFDYGAYKILGIQTNFQGNVDTGAAGASPGTSPIGVAISIGNLALYNGQTLFLQSEDHDASTFEVLPSFSNFLVGNLNTGTGSLRENPYTYAHRRSRFFPGLRDLPVVWGTANVTLQVGAFMGASSTAVPVDAHVPFTAWIVAELVEDYVYGDLWNPSPTARAGANVKLGVQDAGLAVDGRRHVRFVSARDPRSPGLKAP